MNATRRTTTTIAAIVITAFWAVEPGAAAEAVAPRTYCIAVAPALTKDEHARVGGALVRLLLDEAAAGDTVELVNGTSLATVFAAAVPDGSRNVRANRLAPKLAAFRNLSQSASHDAARLRLNVLAVLDQVATRCSATQGIVTVILFGSPLHHDQREPAFNMTADGYIPNDAHLVAGRETTPFGTKGREGLLKNIVVHFCALENYESESHKEAVRRFWSLYVSRQGGALASFSDNLENVFRQAVQGPHNSQVEDVVVASRDMPRMIRPPTRQVARVDLEAQRAQREFEAREKAARELAQRRQRADEQALAAKEALEEATRRAQQQRVAAETALRCADEDAKKAEQEVAARRAELETRKAQADSEHQRQVEQLARQQEQVRLQQAETQRLARENRQMELEQQRLAEERKRIQAEKLTAENSLKEERDVPNAWISDDTVQPAVAPPSSPVGRCRVGIRWRGRKIDWDLFAKLGKDTEEIYFNNPNTAQGCLPKDIRTAPEAENTFEMIEFSRPVDLRTLELWVHFYSGNAPRELNGQVRIYFENQIYEQSFRMPAVCGDGEFACPVESRSASKCWVRLNPMQIVGLAQKSTAVSGHGSETGAERRR